MFYYCELYKFSHFVIPILCCFNAPNNFNKKLEIVPFEKLIFCPIMVLSKCFCSIYNGHCNLGLFVFWFGLAIITLQPLHCWLARFQNISLTSTRNHAFTPWKEIVWSVFKSRIIPTCHPLLFAKSFCLVLQAIWYNNICTFYFFLLNKVLLIYKPYICIIAEWMISARAPSVFISCSLANVPHSSPFQYCHVSIAIYDPQCQLNIAGLYKIGCSNHQPRVPSCPECILIIIKFNMACV